MVVRLGNDERWPRLKHWSREEYHQLAESGVFQGERVQLIGGDIVEMTPQSNDHAVAVGLVEEALRSAFGANHWARVQMPLALSDDSEPEPDLAVVRGSPRDFRAHPDEALLVVEVADATWAFDTGLKANLYAAAGIEDYWVVDVRRSIVRVHRNPGTDADAPFGWRYRNMEEKGLTDELVPLKRPVAPIRVVDVLPGTAG